MKYTTKTIIEAFQNIHKNKYDYSQVKYFNCRTPVKIICEKHGEFLIKPYLHLQGQGCSKCRALKISLTKRSNIDEFLKKAKNKYGDLYDYSQATYINNKTPIKILCKEHGEFFKTPSNHLNSNQGCPKCGKSFKYNTEEFIAKAKKTHNNFYDYSKVVYTKSNEKITIICPMHGEFLQRPSDHLNSQQGCPKCKSSKMEFLVRNYLISHSIIFEEQKTFKTCKNKNVLRFDFFLPQYNILIECQGEQHYKPFKIFGGEEGFKKLQERDNIKKEWVQQNKEYSLIEIKYNKNIEEILSKIKPKAFEALGLEVKVN